jgi:hypothetical protein
LDLEISRSGNQSQPGIGQDCLGIAVARHINDSALADLSHLPDLFLLSWGGMDSTGQITVLF